MKKFNSIIATLLSLSIIISMFSMLGTTVSAADTIEYWDGKTATGYAGGTGTSADPYLIETGAQLYRAIASDFGLKNNAAAYYTIQNDIYLNENYENYANWGTTGPKNNWKVNPWSFKGHLNGGYHTIYGLYSSGPNSGWRNGFIPLLDSGTVSNLIISNAYISGSSVSNGGVFAGTCTNSAKITNCIAHDAVVIASEAPAGICGAAQTANCSITNCATYNLTVSGGSLKSGILGKTWSAGTTVSNCYSIGNLPFSSSANITASNNYTDTAGSAASKATVLTNAEMQGTGAVAKMKLPTTTWVDTESYPTLRLPSVEYPGDVWNGGKAEKFAGGTGTVNDPYLIETGSQLFKAVTDSVAAYYLITADIYLNENYDNYLTWGETEPERIWATGHIDFKGHLDGGMHTIYGMYAKKSNWCVGLVARMTSGATISNLKITKSYVNSGENTAGTFVGAMYDNTKITNCMAYDVAIKNKGVDTGGIAGCAQRNTVTIQYCGTYNLTLSGTTAIGGILGRSAQAINGGNGVRVLNSYSAGYFPLGDINKLWTSDVYTDITPATAKGGTNTITNAEMQGSGAVAKMKLPADCWADTETYPTLAMNDGVKGESWSGKKAMHFAGGVGTAADPYKIETGEQLYKAVSELGKKGTTAAYYVITEDIYLNADYANYATWGDTAPANNWNPTHGEFAGHIDGGLHTVYGLYSRTNSWRNGLIPYMGGSATVTNLKVANAYVRNNNSTVGGITGAMYGTAKITNCMVFDSVLYSASTTEGDAGGIVGAATTNTITVQNCGTYGLDITGFNKGGILGRTWAAKNGGNGVRLANCYSIDNYPLGKTLMNNTWTTYVYTNAAFPEDGDGDKGGTSIVGIEALKGETAAATLSSFDFITTWETTEAYPTLQAIKETNLDQQITASYAISNGENGAVQFTANIVMPTINAIHPFEDNIPINIDGVQKIVQEAGIIISRSGIDVTDISTVKNNPLTGYKAVGYTNGSISAETVVNAGYITVSAIVSGEPDYTAKSYIIFSDGTSVLTDAYTDAPLTEGGTEKGIRFSDRYLKGDANFDGELNIVDLIRMKKYSAKADGSPERTLLNDILDSNGDNSFAATDLAALANDLLAKKEVNPLTAGMTLKFEDNFNSPTLDLSKWDFTDYMAGYSDLTTKTTSDVQYIENEADGNGYLRLTASKDGADTYKTVKTITTGNKLTFVKGYLEIRAKVPVVKGAWPSFWLKSNTGNADLGWVSGEEGGYQTEVDVFEVMGGNAAISELHKWDHTQETFEEKDTRYGEYNKRNSYAIEDNDWHTYGMLWTDEGITMYVDGVEIQTYDFSQDFGSDYVAGMENFTWRPLCISFNNHLFTDAFVATENGGWAADNVVGEDFTESVYDIDYVRLYQDDTGSLYPEN